MGKLLYGVGVNDADYVVYPRINGKQVMCRYYMSWRDMLYRCFSADCHKRLPTYADCTVCEEWHSFMAFRAWMMTQDWQGKELDKDILLSGNKIYSPETCIFVFAKINTLLLDNLSSRGKYPIGVIWHKAAKKFVAQCNIEGKRKHLGCFETAMDAHRAWQIMKIKNIDRIISEQHEKKLIYALKRVLDKIQHDFDMSVETK